MDDEKPRANVVARRQRRPAVLDLRAALCFKFAVRPHWICEFVFALGDSSGLWFYIVVDTKSDGWVK